MKPFRVLVRQVDRFPEKWIAEFDSRIEADSYAEHIKAVAVARGVAIQTATIDLTARRRRYPEWWLTP